jgi:hypothetical protein
LSSHACSLFIAQHPTFQHSNSFDLHSDEIAVLKLTTLQAFVWLTAEALRAQSWKIDRAKTPRTQRKISSHLSELGGLCALARDILTFLAALPRCLFL